MILRNIFLVSFLVFASQVQAEEGKSEAAEVVASTISYCEQLGKTAGFEAEDLSEFVKECEEKHASEKKQAGEE